jgi:hypothetical protein
LGSGGTGAIGATGGSGATGAASSGGGTPSGGAALLYDGPVGGQLADWNSASPYPLVALGKAGSDWYLTLLDIAADGTLGNNVAERVVVWGWPPGTAGAPSLLYDGPVGGTLSGWDAAVPLPLVGLAGPAAPSTWQMTLLLVHPEGTLTDNVAERVVLWGWHGMDPGAPSIRYDGPVGGLLPGWNASAPEPLVAGGESSAVGSWWMTLCSLATNGTIGDNVSDRIVLWGW